MTSAMTSRISRPSRIGNTIASVDIGPSMQPFPSKISEYIMRRLLGRNLVGAGFRCVPAVRPEVLPHLFHHSSQAMTAGRTGTVAQIESDSLCDSRLLVAVHAQTHRSELAHDELAHLQFRPEAVLLAADLV